MTLVRIKAIVAFGIMLIRGSRQRMNGFKSRLIKRLKLNSHSAHSNQPLIVILDIMKILMFKLKV